MYKILSLILCSLFVSQVYAASPTTMTTTDSQDMSQQQTGAAAGTLFLTQNKTKPGVVTLTDGLQYKVLKAGTGPKPKATDVVTVSYSGRLINGQEFDNSNKHGGTVDFQVGQVIPGWVEALTLMPVGSTWEVYIPAQLAYGDAGSPPVIGPNETLIFTINLQAIKNTTAS